ncbi:hypothetical protein cypCar_00021459 [Cyprinus carpio]|nr:hypothetical protein cypCar_00021459 [Cyprinus carpio]
MEGDSVTLNTDDTDLQKNNQILWRFGHNILIAQINRKNNKSRFYDDIADGRFRDRLQLDHQTGSLTITNTRTTDSGLYKVTSTSTQKLFNTFSLTVYEVYICSCGFTEAVIRLVISALVGVAAVAVLIYEFRSRSLQQRRGEKTTSSNSD